MTEKLEFIIAAKDQFSGSFKKLTGYLPSVKTLAIGTAGAMAAMGAATFAVVKQTAEAYDKVQKLSDQLGVSNQFLSRYQVAANFSGIAVETMNKAVQKLQIGIGEAAKGTGTAKAALEDLNISLFTASGRLKTAEQIMPELANGLHNVSDASQRAELAAKLFGQRGVEMLQMFTGGADGLKKMTDAADRFGVTISAKAGANAAAFNDAIYRAQLALQGLRNYMAEQSMPMITGMANRFSNFVVNNRDKILAFSESFIKAMGWIAEKGAYAVALLIDSWRGLKMIWEVLNIAFSELVGSILSGVTYLTEKMQSFMEATNVRGIFDYQIANLQTFTREAQIAIGVLNETANTAWGNLNALASERMAVSQVSEFVGTIKNALAEIRAEGEAGATAESLLSVSDTAAQRTVANVNTMTAAQTAAYEQLLAAHDEYYLSEEERLEEWYVRQAEMYAEHEEAKAVLDEVYLARRMELDNRAREEKARADAAADALKKKQVEAREKAISVIQQVFGKKAFEALKKIRIAHAVMTGYEAAINAWNAGMSTGGPWAPAVAAAYAASSLAWTAQRIQSIQKQEFAAAHGGLDYVPKEQTYLLDQGERVLSPRQNRDLTDFMDQGQGAAIQVENFNVNITVMPNATNPAALLAMNKQDWREVAEDKIIPAICELNARGIGL